MIIKHVTRKQKVRRARIKKVMIFALVCVLCLAILVFFGKNPFGLRDLLMKYKTIALAKYHSLTSEEVTKPVAESVSLSSLTDHEINEYLTINIPTDFFVMSEDEIANKYEGGKKAVILTNGEVDLTLQFNDDEYVENFSKEMSEYRDKTVASMQELLPSISFNTDTTIEVDGKIIPIIKFETYSNKDKINNIVALIEVKTDLVIISINSKDDYGSNEELFYSILNTAKFATW